MKLWIGRLVMDMTKWKKIAVIFGMVVTLSSLNAKVIKLDSTLDENSSSVKSHDVKFIVESFLGSANWEPGTSKIAGTGVDLLDYDTTGLKLYSVKGKVNIFDTDVLEVEKFGTFTSGDEQEKLLKLKQYNKDSSFEGVNISLRAFLILKYFYLYNYDFLDDLEYQYDYYNFYAKATNNIDAIYWWGKENEVGVEGENYVNIPKGSRIELTTEFNEHRFYALDLKSYFKRFLIDSFKIGYFSTYWAKESFVGVTNSSGTIPVIQTVLLEAEGISFLLKHSMKNIDLDLKLRYNYGLDNYIVLSHKTFDTDYYGVDFMIDYQYDIYEKANWLLFTKLSAMYSAKWFDNDEVTMDTDRIFAFGLSLGVLF